MSLFQLQYYSQSTPFPPAANASAQLTLSLWLGPRYSSPLSPTGSLSDVLSSLYSHGASLSPRES